MSRLRIAALVLAVSWSFAPLAGAGGSEQAASSEASDASSSCLNETVDAIQARYETVRDFAARFEQTTHPARLGASAAEKIVSRGRVVVAKPARMRWSYESPEPSLVVSDGETLWIYDPAFREAQRLRAGEEFLSGAAVQFLLGEGELRRDFAISVEGCASDRVQLLLVPREPASYERLRVVADPRTGDLSETEVHDLLGNVTAISFSDLEFNRDPPSETFRFDPPEGVTVVDLSTPVAPGSP